MQALKSHLSTCFLDILLPGATFIPEKSIRVLVLISLLTILRVWLPLVIMGINFRNIKEIWAKFNCKRGNWEEGGD